MGRFEFNQSTWIMACGLVDNTGWMDSGFFSNQSLFLLRVTFPHFRIYLYSHIKSLFSFLFQTVILFYCTALLPSVCVCLSFFLLLIQF